MFPAYQWQESLLSSHSHLSWIPAQICGGSTHHRMWWLHLGLTVEGVQNQCHKNKKVGKARLKNPTFNNVSNKLQKMGPCSLYETLITKIKYGYITTPETV